MIKKFSFSFTAIVVVTLFSALFSVTAQAADPDFGSLDQFRQRWLAQDHLVGTPGVLRPYTWGPNIPNAPTNLSESYNNSPGGQRRVLYFDKARMEINNPANGFVTTGLVVKELVSGQRQDGDNTFIQLAPSKTQVAGDAVSVNPNGPVYASFKDVVTLGNADGHSKPNAVGSVINQSIAKSGATGTINPPENLMVGAYETQTGHNIARPFQDFKNLRGPTTDPTTGATQNDQPIYTNQPTSNVFGLAISEPYWVNTKVGGQDRTVLVQLFERRVLTYNPALSGQGVEKVEMGNLGQHYYQWRYVESKTGPAPTPPVPSSTGLDSEENNLLNLLNQYRQSNGKPTLSLNSNLTTAARWLSNDMATKNYFDHVDSQGRDFVARLAAFGYNGNTYKGENIAAGFNTGLDVLEGWRGSASHNANMLDPMYHVVGIARIQNSATHEWYWTLDLGGQ